MKIQELRKKHNFHRNLVEKKEYTEYRKRVEKKYRIIGRDNYGKFVKTYYQTIAELATNYNGGALVRNTMYVFMFRIPKKRQFVQSKNRKFFSFHSDNYSYNISIQLPSEFNHWVFKKRSFNFKQREIVVKNLKEGKKYKSYFKSVRKLKML